MTKYIYEVRLAGGASNPAYRASLKNVSDLNGKAPDFGGMGSVCLVSHHMDIDTVKLLFEDGLKKAKKDLSIEEITKETLNSEYSHHRIYTDMIDDFYLPFGSYPNIK